MYFCVMSDNNFYVMKSFVLGLEETFTVALIIVWNSAVNAFPEFVVIVVVVDVVFVVSCGCLCLVYCSASHFKYQDCSCYVLCITHYIQ